MKRISCMLLALALCFAAALAEPYDLGAGVTLELDGGDYLLVATPETDDEALAPFGLTRETLLQALEEAPAALMAFAKNGAVLNAHAEPADGTLWDGLDDETLAGIYGGMDASLNETAGENGSFEGTACDVVTVPFGRAVVTELHGSWFGQEAAVFHAAAQGEAVAVSMTLIFYGPADESVRALLDAALNGLSAAPAEAE